MKLTRLFIANPHGFDIRDQPVSSGVPLPAGIVRASEDVHLLDEDGRPVSHVARPLSRWPDGSVRWLLIETLACVDSGQRITLHVQRREMSGENARRPRTASVDRPPGPDTLHSFSSEGIDFHLESDASSGFLTARPEASGACEAATAWLELIDVDGERRRLDSVESRWIHHAPEHHAVLESVGEVPLEPDSLPVRVTIRQTVFARTALSRIEIVLHNPNPAAHPGGVWDLGDPGSLRFGACALIVRTSGEATVGWRLDARGPWREIGNDRFSLFQASSGGERWNSPVHVDEHGRPTPAFRGYRVDVGSREVAAGDRCEPALNLCSRELSMTICPAEFWQRFPKALRSHRRGCRVELFPALEGIEHELQGGESSTFVLYLGFGEKNATLDWVNRPLHVSLDRASVFHSSVLRDWHDEADDPRYSALLDKGLRGEHSFFRKREEVDEYGWRHFGDLYADHETWNQFPTGVFVSHYNNQYDPILGFARRYLQTGDRRWFELMDDLARHVLDIDLYRTDADRPEYNQGLFWHTDHYVQAHTATHRTYSRHQRSERHELTGGGPGGQHCYTSGLCLYHQLTGSARARQAVFDMTRWMDCVYEGSGSVLERVRKGIGSDLPTFVKLIRKEKVLRYRYPLDRGVGNYIRALLDCFELDGERRHLDKAGSIIKETVGPDDDIDERGLDDIERTWFYTVFLQAVVTFIDTKRENGETDGDFHYARDSLLHYARWMLVHEAPYLDSADKLEYANDTWVAQDVRKAAILHAAHRYSRDDGQAFLERATYFKDYALDVLERSNTAHYTRIQAILLQNQAPVGNVWSARTPYAIDTMPVIGGRPAHATLRSHASEFAAAWWRCLRTFSLAREMAWLGHRLPGIARTRRRH